MRKALKIVIGSILVILILAVIPYIYINSLNSGYVSDSVSLMPQADAGMILGAGILNNGELSPILRDRAIAAIYLFKADKVKKIIVSGNHSDTSVDEVDPVVDYLVKNDVPKEDILADNLGLDTYSSMYRAKNVYGIKSLIIVTQYFHLKRSLYIARSLGLDAHGLSADNGTYISKNYWREFFADPKAIIDVVSRRVP